MFVFFNQTKAIVMRMLVNREAPVTLRLRLFANDVTPQPGHDETDYVEASFPGYAAIDLAPSSFQITEGEPSIASYVEQKFERNVAGSNQLQYGYYITQGAGRAIGAERFVDGPYRMMNSGDKVFVEVALGASQPPA